MSRPLVAVPLLTLLTIALWTPSIANGFVFDDLINILRNDWIKDWGLLGQAFTRQAAGFDPNYNTSFYRPMMHVLYAVVYAMAGARPWAYHFLNVAFHLLAVLGVYLLVRAVVARWGNPVRHPHLPLIAAVIFCVHPVHTEPVLWVAGITDLSCAAFGLLALVAYLRAFRSAGYVWVAGALLLTSLLCKETGAIFLLIMLLFESFEARRGARWRFKAAAIRMAAMLAVSGLYVTLRLSALASLAPSAAQHPHEVVDLVAAASALFARYMAMLIAPTGFSVMRSVPLDTGFTEPLAVIGVVVASGIVAATVRYRRLAMVTLLVAFAVLPVFPVLYVPVIEGGVSVFGERYLYVSVLGISLLAGLALEEARHRFKWGFVAATTLLALVVAGGWAVAAERTRVWSSSLTLWSDAVEKAPQSAAAHEGMCFALYTAGRVPEALDACARSLALDPMRVDARLNHAAALLALRRAGEAKTDADIALSLRSNSAQALVIRGLACMMLDQVEEALSSYRQALDVDPDSAEAHNVMGVALVRSGRRTEALAHLERAVALDQNNPEYRDNLNFIRNERARE